MTLLRLAVRYCFWGQGGIPLTTVLSIVGMSIGVASLVAAMAVFSGFESTLQKTIVDISGHLMVIKRGALTEKEQAEGFQKIEPLLEGFQASSRFYFLEAVLASRGIVAGVGVEGVDPDKFSDVLRLESRLIDGKLKFRNPEGQLPGVVIGKQVAKRFGYKVGDMLRLVVPVINDPNELGSFVPKLKKFRVNGIISYGHHEFDSRFVMMDIDIARSFTGKGAGAFGYKLRFDRDDQALAAEVAISENYQSQYYTRSWKAGNRNLFEALQLERMIVFFVLLIIVIVACFNIASALFISVVRRYKDISILKAMGATRSDIIKIFALQGVTLGVLGSVLGVLLGLGVCWLLIQYQAEFGLISGEVYQLDKIDLNFRWIDFLYIFVASLGICLLATLAPALRGSDLSPVEGLRYD